LNRHRHAAGALAVGAGVLLASAALAFPEGGPWQAAADAGGCSTCHFAGEPITASPALALAGLPQRIEPGRRYRLELRLADPELRAAGFLIAAHGAAGAAGRFVPADARSEANGHLARHTRAGTVPVAAGAGAWTLEWQAPASLSGPVRFEVWANAADDDRSPLGDRIHHRIWEVPARR